MSEGASERVSGSAWSRGKRAKQTNNGGSLRSLHHHTAVTLSSHCARSITTTYPGCTYATGDGIPTCEKGKHHHLQSALLVLDFTAPTDTAGCAPSVADTAGCARSHDTREETGNRRTEQEEESPPAFGSPLTRSRRIRNRTLGIQIINCGTKTRLLLLVRTPRTAGFSGRISPPRRAHRLPALR